jgi:hypothetical protein
MLHCDGGRDDGPRERRWGFVADDGHQQRSHGAAAAAAAAAARRHVKKILVSGASSSLRCSPWVPRCCCSGKTTEDVSTTVFHRRCGATDRNRGWLSSSKAMVGKLPTHLLP